jgi:PAS domain S-box-containing protein
VWNTRKSISPLQTAMFVCLVAALSYLAPKLEGTLIMHPRTIWPLWPGCALLVPVLMLVPRRSWSILIPVALASFALYDFEAGVPLRSIAWFIPADTVQVLIAALCLTYFFGETPQLNSVEALAKYLCFVVILAPFAAAFLSAPGIRSDGYWNNWGISFFSEVLAFLTLTPAALSWLSNGRSWLRQSRTYHLEAATLFAGLGLLSYLSFTASVGSNWPALLYSLVPFLLWAALRFGSIGISSAMILVAFLSIWGAAHGRGPFLDPVPFNSMFSIQLFLICTATPFMALAGVVEEHKRDVEALRKTEERFRLASRAGKMFAYEWDAATDVVVRSAGSAEILGTEPGVRTTGEEMLARVHPEDLERLKYMIAELRPEKPHLQITHRMLRADGTVIWVERNSRAQFDERGKMLRMIGMVADVTARVRAERELSELGGRLIHAQEEERTRIARELHEDLGQRMALLQINVERFKQDTAELSSKARRELNNIAELTSEISSELHEISHQLHPSRLETLGLVTTLGSFCKEFSLQHNLRVQFVHQDVPEKVPQDISLCLFRVVQEALRNVVKHSRAAEVKVELTRHNQQIDLCISDAGAGFDPAFAKVDGGLGLISMRERLRLVGGHLSIESEVSHGTRIRARISLSSTAGQGSDDARRRAASA